MDKEENEILFLFFDLLHKIRDVLLINRPDLLDLIKSDMQVFTKDPFGKYFQSILYIGQNSNSSMKEFADYFNLKKGTATGLIDQLVSRDIVARVDNLTDRRKVELILTDPGKMIFQKALAIQKDEISSVVDSLTVEDRNHLKDILVKINTALVIKKGKKPIDLHIINEH